MTQNDITLAHLIKHGSLTPLQAMGVYGIHRLPARIYELKQAGHDIRKTTRTDGRGRQYAEYRLYHEPAFHGDTYVA